MCSHCHGGWGHCADWDYYPYHGPRRHYYYEESDTENRREHLEEEKRILERRLKEIEASIGEAK